MKLEFRPLENRFARLEPFAPELKEEVRAAVDCDPDAWAIMPVNPMGDRFESFWTSTCGAPLEQRMAYCHSTSFRCACGGRVQLPDDLGQSAFR